MACARSAALLIFLAKTKENVLSRAKSLNKYNQSCHNKLDFRRLALAIRLQQLVIQSNQVSEFFQDCPGRRANLGSFVFRLFSLSIAVPQTTQLQTAMGQVQFALKFQQLLKYLNKRKLISVGNSEHLGKAFNTLARQ